MRELGRVGPVFGLPAATAVAANATTNTTTIDDDDEDDKAGRLNSTISTAVRQHNRSRSVG